MNLRRSLLLVFTACLFSNEQASAEVRIFTDTTGRTIQGELVAVNGDFVTIKRTADQQNFTVKATNFSEADIAFFTKNGLKPTAAPTANAAGTPATSAPLRLDVKIYSGKSEKNTRSTYEKVQKITYKIDIKNTETKRDMPKAHGIIVVLARVLSRDDESQVIGREEFDVELPALKSFTYDMQKPITTVHDGDRWGLRASGYVFVLKDTAGKVLNVSGSSENLAKNQENALAMKVNDLCASKDYHSLGKTGSTYSAN